jgi:hypothetical protein
MTEGTSVSLGREEALAGAFVAEHPVQLATGAREPVVAAVERRLPPLAAQLVRPLRVEHLQRGLAGALKPRARHRTGSGGFFNLSTVGGGPLPASPVAASTKAPPENGTQRNRASGR